MGGLMQFGNDIFDIYKDCQHKIDTLITTASKVKDVRVAFKEMMKSSFATVYSTRHTPKNIRKFLRLFSMSLCARCFVFLDQLEKKEKQTGQFTPYGYARKDLVCDMEKIKNKWRTIRSYIKYNQ